MTLKYDIDISYIMPAEVFDDPTHAEMMKQAGIELNARGNYIAKFRDPATAAALNGASEQIKEFFKACGFAFIPSGGQLPDGKFDARFDNHMTDVIKRFETNIAKFDLPKADQGPAPWNEFNLGEMILWFAKCEAIDATPYGQSGTSEGMTEFLTAELDKIAAPKAPNASFQDRIARLNTGNTKPSRKPAPVAQPASGRKAKLLASLHHLDQAGIRGNSAYPPAFRVLAKWGVVIKPLHFWSFVPLTLFGFILLVSIFAATILACLLLGVMPRPVATMINLGPNVFFGVCGALALGMSVWMKVQAASARLPRWKQL